MRGPRAVGVALVLAGAGAVALAVGLRGPITEPPIPETVADKVTCFATDHPQWAALRDGRKDMAALRLNHAKHMHPDLKGAPPGGLRCTSCHVPDDAGRYMKAVTFEAHCAQCHQDQIGSVNPAPGVVEAMALAHPVSGLRPQGSEDPVLAAVELQYARWVRAEPEKFAIKPPAGAGEPAANPDAAPAEAGSRKRRKSGDEPAVKAAAVPVFESAEARSQWLTQQTKAELAKLASANRCGYCHTNITVADEASGRFAVVGARVPERWMPRAQFAHHAHEMVRCDECHAAKESTSTSDVLMPGIDSCRECHAPTNWLSKEHGGAGAPHGCVLCHWYHQPAPPDDGAREIEDLLKE